MIRRQLISKRFSGLFVNMCLTLSISWFLTFLSVASIVIIFPILNNFLSPVWIRFQSLASLKSHKLYFLESFLNKLMEWIAKKFSWKYKLQKSIITFGIVRKLIVAAVASASYVYFYMNELLILTIAVYFFHPTWLGDLVSVNRKVFQKDTPLPELDQLQACDVHTESGSIVCPSISCPPNAVTAWTFDATYGVIPQETQLLWSQAAAKLPRRPIAQPLPPVRYSSQPQASPSLD